MCKRQSGERTDLRRRPLRAIEQRRRIGPESFYYDSHPPEAALALLQEAGFTIAASEYLNPPR